MDGPRIAPGSGSRDTLGRGECRSLFLTRPRLPKEKDGTVSARLTAVHRARARAQRRGARA